MADALRWDDDTMASEICMIQYVRVDRDVPGAPTLRPADRRDETFDVQEMADHVASLLSHGTMVKITIETADRL